jgi:L-ascorbate metabolism protein UlaG (beta-lactamase superfamily)
VCLLCAAALAPAALARDAEAALFPRALGSLGLPGAPVGTVEWTGVAGVVLEVEGTRVAFDPFVTRPGLLATVFLPARPDAGLVARAFPRLDAVFVGHTHFDHAMDLPAVARSSPGATIHGSETTAEACRRSGVDPARLAVARDGDAVSVGPFRVEAVASRHGVVPLFSRIDRERLPRRGLPWTALRWPRGEVLAWRVEVSGRSVHVHGSAGIDDAALARQAPCDVLVACVAARRGTPRFLERLCERLRPEVFVPCHHDDFFRPLSSPPRPVATLRADALLEECEALARAHGTRTVPLPRGVPVPF